MGINKDNDDFWTRCISASCVIVAVRLYSDYADSNYSNLIGIKYAALNFNNRAVAPDFWFDIDEGHAGVDTLFDTPEEALEKYEIAVRRRDD